MVGHSGQAVEISARSKKRSLQVAENGRGGSGVLFGLGF